MKDIIKRKISIYDCTIDFNKGTVSIIDDWNSNYGVIYEHNIAQYDYLYQRNKQIIGMDSSIRNKKILAFFENQINKYYLTEKHTTKVCQECNKRGILKWVYSIYGTKCLCANCQAN